MSFLYVVFCSLIIYNVSEGKIIQGIIGRNVSFSWTFSNTKNDAILILHNDSIFHKMLPPGDHSVQDKAPNRNKVSADYTTPGTVTVTVQFRNITKYDAGVYRVVQQFDLEDLDKSFLLNTKDESVIPKIVMVENIILDLVLECTLASVSMGEFFWMLNGSMIRNQERYSLNGTFMSIRHLTADDQYNSYKCSESGSGLDSDPYKIKISGPNVIMFSPNITTVKEHFGVYISCLADCYPVCFWKWTKLDISLGQENVVSTENALYIQNITRNERGMYSCRVLNNITGKSLENATSIDIVYGPDVIRFNSSDNIIQLDKKDSISVSCSADCFPQCQITWSEASAETIISGADLKLLKEDRDHNYTCYATNARNDNATISDTIYVIRKLEVSHHATNSVTSVDDEKDINHNTTTAITSNDANEGFLSKSYLIYLLSGIGLFSAVLLIACLLHKLRICIEVNRISNRDTTNAGGNETLQEEDQSENYWTIVTNAKGELSTAIETFVEPIRELPQGTLSSVPITNESKQPKMSIDVTVDEEVGGYLNPIHSYPIELDDYIHPVHSVPVNTEAVSSRRSAAF